MTTPLVNTYLDAYRAPPSDEELRELSPLTEDSKSYKSWIMNRHRRDHLVNVFAWAIPTERVIRRIAKLTPICDLGCGTGYWAWLLAQAGAQVLAVDAAPPHQQPNGWHHGPDRALGQSYVDIIHADVADFEVPADHTLLLCWPPYRGPMAATALERYRGNRVVYVGEGSGGCTGTDTFHETLERDWNLVEKVDIPQWEGIHDHVWLYARR